MKRILFALLLLLTFGCSQAPKLTCVSCPSAPGYPVPSVVLINTICITEKGIEPSGGSGAIIGPETIVTATHVLDGFCTAEVHYDGETYKVTDFVSKGDIAVATVPGLYGPALPVASRVVLGEDIFCAGYPVILGAEGDDYLSATRGVIATKDVKSGASKYHRVTAQLFFGSSGGVCTNSSGEIVGVVSYLVSYNWEFFLSRAEDLTALLKEQS